MHKLGKSQNNFKWTGYRFSDIVAVMHLCLSLKLTVSERSRKQ